MAADARSHRWKFFRAGGFDQVRIDGADDLRALGELDQKLWVALGCPVHGLEFDDKTLELIDTDGDGRIRAPEVIAAVRWVCSVLKAPEGLLKRSPSLALSAIDAENEEGARLLASAKRILANLGKKGDKRISIEDTADTVRIFAATRFNGDGVVPVASAEDEATKQTIRDVMDCLGADVDRGGEPGVSQAKVDAFFAAAEAFSAWWIEADEHADTVLPLGDRTPAAAEAFFAVKAKIDDYFARTRLAAFDPRAVAPLNRDEAEYAAIAAKVLHTDAPEVASFPLARIEAGRALPLTVGLNPAWVEPLERFVREVVAPLSGDTTELTEQAWRALSARFAAYEAWRAKKAGAAVEKLGLPRVRELLASGAKARLDELLAEDRALEPEASAIAAVDKLVRYHKDLAALLDNFVTFRDFYGRKKALFQAGTLYVDGRSCDLCIKVKDTAAHVTLAAASGTYLLYCDCVRKGGGEKMAIVAAVTGGDADNLAVGRNGVFYDRKGNDWDATVVKIVQNPISVREAFWTPYKRIAKLVGDQIEKFASSRDKDVHDKIATGVNDTAKAAEGTAAPAPAAPAAAAPATPATPDASGKTFEVGALAAIGLAIGAVGSALAALATGFLGLAWWQMPLAVAGVLLAISGPSMLLAWLKLRRRNLGPLLDATGWAINARATINLSFGSALTAVATLPPNAERSMEDPYADPKPPYARYVIALVLLAAFGASWHFGYLALAWAKLSVPRVPAIAAPSASASAGAAPSAAPGK